MNKIKNRKKLRALIEWYVLFPLGVLLPFMSFFFWAVIR